MAHRYADEHQGRVTRGQGSGRTDTIDEYRGAALIYDHLSTSNALASVEALNKKLDQLEENINTNHRDKNEAFRKGVRVGIDTVRKQINAEYQ